MVAATIKEIVSQENHCDSTTAYWTCRSDHRLLFTVIYNEIYIPRSINDTDERDTTEGQTQRELPKNARY